MTVIIGQILTVITSCSRHLPRDGDTGHLTSRTQNNCSHQPDTQTLRHSELLCLSACRGWDVTMIVTIAHISQTLRLNAELSCLSAC